MGQKQCRSICIFLYIFSRNALDQNIKIQSLTGGSLLKVKIFSLLPNAVYLVCQKFAKCLNLSTDKRLMEFSIHVFTDFECCIIRNQDKLARLET
jgi:hypothetical protein